jgi:hypothetical protein
MQASRTVRALGAADVLARKGDAGAAIDALSNALVRDADNASLHAALGHILLDRAAQAYDSRGTPCTVDKGYMCMCVYVCVCVCE